MHPDVCECFEPHEQLENKASASGFCLDLTGWWTFISESHRSQVQLKLQKQNIWCKQLWSSATGVCVCVYLWELSLLHQTPILLLVFDPAEPVCTSLSLCDSSGVITALQIWTLLIWNYFTSLEIHNAHSGLFLRPSEHPTLSCAWSDFWTFLDSPGMFSHLGQLARVKSLNPRIYSQPSQAPTPDTRGWLLVCGYAYVWMHVHPLFSWTGCGRSKGRVKSQSLTK